MKYLQMTEQENQPETLTMYKRIGSSAYEVTIHFSQTSKETMPDKIFRLIKNEAFAGKAAS